ncbi:protein of unknown function [Halovenus aranensis]|uniref:DUF4260 domain-containing protein n=1 Tax=Halovenus aranensis TaxID=890420 RepID=A0A1G8XEM4_9EURY|nr:DUF4260 family protein [Halovenus aranensis]SDJ88230.1 protein of unknown function [Halovenus aranensis]
MNGAYTSAIAVHTYLAPVTLGAAGASFGMSLPVWVALVWAAHIGADRAVGYGLKYPTEFKHTHLSGQGDHNTAGLAAVAPADE